MSDDSFGESQAQEDSALAETNLYRRSKEALVGSMDPLSRRRGLALGAAAMLFVAVVVVAGAVTWFST